MNKKKKGVAAWALLVVGAVMMLISLGNLLAARELLQYAVVPRGEMDAAVSQLLTVKREVADTLADCTSALAVGGVTEKASVSAGGVNQTCAVYAVGEGWFEADPVFLTAGRRLAETELKLGDKVAMVDEQLAFQLFGSELPEDAKATIDGVEYAVVGAYRHRRSVGEAAQYSAYVPLLSANQNARDELLFIAVPVANTGARTMFESTMRANWEQDGSFISIGKEALRQRMIVRMLLLVFGLSVIFRLMRRMNGAAARSWTRFQERLRWNYFRTAAPSLMAFLGICLIGYGALLALLYALAAFSIQPLYTFTEWVPENVVEWSSLKAVFWSLAGDSAKLVRVGTRELRIVEFWGKILRWGTLGALYGALLLRIRRAKN